MSDEYVALTLESFARRIREGRFASVELSESRPAVELAPPDCPNDGYVHRVAGPETTVTLRITHQ